MARKSTQTHHQAYAPALPPRPSIWMVAGSSRRRLRLLVAILVSLAFLPLATCTRLAEPKQSTMSYRYVDDGAHLLDEDTASQLRGALTAFQADSGNQVLLLTVPSLGGDSIEQFAVKEFQRRGVGRKGEDNGVMLVVAPNEHQARIEVGYGLEGQLTDLRSARVLREQVIPSMRDGDAAKALVDGAEAIVSTLGGNWAALRQAGPQAPVTVDTKPPDRTPTSAAEWSMGGLALVMLLAMLVIFSLVTLHLPVIGWMLYPVLIPFWGFPGKLLDSDMLATAGMMLFALGIPWLKCLIGNNLEYVGSLAPAQRRQLKPHGLRAHLSDLLMATAGGFRYAEAKPGSRSGGGSGSSSDNDDRSSSSSSSSDSSSSSSSSSYGDGGSSGGGGASGSW